VLADVAPSMRVFGKPVRGPVVRVTPFDSDEEALALASALPCLAAAYVWTADLERARRLGSAVESPVTWVNSSNRQDQRSDADQAGIGFYTESRSVFMTEDDMPVPRFGA